MEITNIKDLTIVLQELGSKLNWTQTNIQSYLNGLMNKITTYTIISNVIWILFLLGMMVAAYIGFKKYKNKTDDLGFWVMMIILLFIFSATFVIGLSLDIYRCFAAPELVFLNSLIS